MKLEGFNMFAVFERDRPKCFYCFLEDFTRHLSLFVGPLGVEMQVENCRNSVDGGVDDGSAGLCVCERNDEDGVSEW